MDSRPDLFAVSDSDARLHPNFRALRDSPDHGDARALMNALYLRMGDPNGNFLGDFRGHGFHSRLFELACFAYLDDAEFAVDRQFAQPDFLAFKDGERVALEAVTANPPSGRDPDISVRHVKQISQEELEKKIYEEFPQRLLATLQKKLKHRYHKLPHCVGVPLVLITAPYFEPGSVFYSDDALLPCLYGYSETEIPRFRATPFFFMQYAASVSAVVYCNQFTVPRFFRLAPRSTNNAPALRVTREGMCMTDHTDSEFLVARYRYDLSDPSAPRETWAQGVTVYHNPNADIPLPAGLLPCTSTFRIDQVGLRREIHGLHTVTSMMWMFEEGDHAQQAG